MPASSRPKRVLLYSHDSFGLGHVSRCRTIANAIVEADHSVSVLIISGSPVIGSYEFRSGIDFVRVPGVVKQIDTGEYDSANLRVGVEHTLEMRTRIIRDTADIYRPDLFIVDKEPTGLRGEVVPALHLLKGRGTPLVLGLRDVMDDPAALAQEWERKHVVPALRDLYDEIWIYGLPQINKPMTGIAVPPSVRHKMFYTGYLHRDLPLHTDIPHEIEEIDGPFILVTAGGGGDGADLIDWVLAAYESDPHIPYGAVIVFGPFMSANEREAFKERATRFRNIRTLTFTNNLGALMQRAAGVVAMGGYNTFCEILSFDKKAIIVPRTRPRLEQFIRARAARNVGLIEMLDADVGRDPHAMATALRQLPQQGLPSDVVVPGLLDGLGNVLRLVAKQLAHPHRGPAALESMDLFADVPAADFGPGARQDLITGHFMSSPLTERADTRVAVILKGWPRLSETFIAQEIAGLEARGVALEIWSLRRPTDKARHPVHDRVAGRTVYLPEYLKDDPGRVLAAWRKARRLPGYKAARRKFLADLRRDPSANRVRRWGQALVLAAELAPSVERLYAHFLHTPSSVTRYAAALRDLPWSISAHAKDIWTSEPWDVTEKLTDCSWLVTCTAAGLHRLRQLAPWPERLKLVYHGLDFGHLPPPRGARPRRDGSDAADPVTILSIGRKVEKKGYDDLLTALARLPAALHWRFEHIGAGELSDSLKTQAAALGIADRCTWHGAQPQKAVFAALARADLFALASKKAADGDQDGLPNVLMEAAHQGLAIVSTHAAAIGEFISDRDNGLLVSPGAPDELATALVRLVGDPDLRQRLSARASETVRTRFSFDSGVDWIASALGQVPLVEARAAE